MDYEKKLTKLSKKIGIIYNKKGFQVFNLKAFFIINGRGEMI